MNKNILKKIIENKDKFIPGLFTAKQIQILEKYLSKTKLTKTEQSYLYSAIKRKIDALTILNVEYHINGTNLLPDRIIKAKGLLKGKENAFISGSFLFSEKYRDVDIYVISNRRKQYYKDKNHFIFITKEDLKKPIFQSAAKYCVSNFLINLPEPTIKKPNFNDLIMAYEGSVIEILDNDDQKNLRDLIFEYYLQIKNLVLDSFELTTKFNEIKSLVTGKRIEYVNKITKELMLKLFSETYLYNELSPFSKKIEKQAEEYEANENLLIYVDLFNEVKNVCRRAKT